jgi:hypothetical protein
MASSSTMRAVVIHQAGGPEALKIQQWQKPVPMIAKSSFVLKPLG